MSRDKFLRLLGFEFASILVVIVAFAAISSRPIASVIGATAFVGVGLYIVWTLWRSGQPTRYASFYLVLIHLVLTVIMAVHRVMNWNLPLEEITLWGIPALVFHRGTQICFWALIAATCYDMFRQMKNELRPVAG